MNPMKADETSGIPDVEMGLRLGLRHYLEQITADFDTCFFDFRRNKSVSYIHPSHPWLA